MKRKFIIICIFFIVFLFGMYIGLAINYPKLQEKDSKIRNLYVELYDLKEIIHRQQFNITD